MKTSNFILNIQVKGIQASYYKKLLLKEKDKTSRFKGFTLEEYLNELIKVLALNYEDMVSHCKSNGGDSYKVFPDFGLGYVLLKRDVVLIQLDFVEVTFPRVDFTSCSVQGLGEKNGD